MATTGSAGTRLVILRGNSGSGKSSTARELRARLGRGVAWVEQDYLRRTVLREKDAPGGANIGLIDQTVRYALDCGYDVVLEGILCRRAGPTCPLVISRRGISLLLVWRRPVWGLRRRSRATLMGWLLRVVRLCRRRWLLLPTWRLTVVLGTRHALLMWRTPTRSPDDQPHDQCDDGWDEQHAHHPPQRLGGIRLGKVQSKRHSSVLLER